MVKARDPAWEHVTIAAGYGSSGTKRWTCRYCNVTYTGGPLRIRAHLLGVRGYDIAACTQAPRDIGLARPGSATVDADAPRPRAAHGGAGDV